MGWRGWTVFAALGVMFYLVRHAGAARAAVITYLNPVVATLLGVWVLREPLGVGGLIAFGTILLGSWLATRGSPRTEALGQSTSRRGKHWIARP